MTLTLRILAVLTVLVAATVNVGAGQHVYSLTPFDGYTGIQASAINDDGMVVGYCTNPNGGLLKSFVWTPTGGMVELEDQTYARDVNNSGMIVGENKDGDSLYWTDSTASAQTITAAGTNGGIAEGVNDDGNVVGRTGYTVANPRVGYIWNATDGITLIPDTQEANAVNSSGEVVGNQQFRWTASGGLVEIGTEADTWGMVEDINDAGTAVGHLGDTGGFMQTSDGTITALGALSGYNNSYAQAINETGQIVGDLDYGSTAFLYEAGTMTALGDLLDPGSEWDALKYANDINENGWIVGSGTLNGEAAAFVMVPEPATMAVLGLGGLGALIRRRRA